MQQMHLVESKQWNYRKGYAGRTCVHRNGALTSTCVYVCVDTYVWRYVIQNARKWLWQIPYIVHMYIRKKFKHIYKYIYHIHGIIYIMIIAYVRAYLSSCICMWVPTKKNVLNKENMNHQHRSWYLWQFKSHAKES